MPIKYSLLVNAIIIIIIFCIYFYNYKGLFSPFHGILDIVILVSGVLDTLLLHQQTHYYSQLTNGCFLTAVNTSVQRGDIHCHKVILISCHPSWEATSPTCRLLRVWSVFLGTFWASGTLPFHTSLPVHRIRCWIRRVLVVVQKYAICNTLKKGTLKEQNREFAPTALPDGALKSQSETMMKERTSNRDKEGMN